MNLIFNDKDVRKRIYKDIKELHEFLEDDKTYHQYLKSLAMAVEIIRRSTL